MDKRGWTLVLLSALVLMAKAEPMLRYTADSCENLTPQYVDSDFNDLNLGPEDEEDENRSDSEDTNSDIVFESPKRLNSRNPPFTIQIEHDQYRRNRMYKINIVATDYYDAFMIQVRGRDPDDGNTTIEGTWVEVPGIAVGLKCGGNRLGAVIDKGRPIRLGNLTFTWRAPKKDRGLLRVEASIAYNDAYALISSNYFGFNTYPVPTTGCGRQQSCYRACRFNPACDSDAVVYMLTMNPDDQGNIDFRMGGFLSEPTDYIGLGLGQDRKKLRNTDIVICTRRDARVDSSHYLLENKDSIPYLHREPIRLVSSDIDEETGFVWCEFRRPIVPTNLYDLDLTEKMYHFYLWGKMDNKSRPILPKHHRLQKSYMRLNASEVFNEVTYNPEFLRAAGQSSASRGGCAMALMIVAALAAHISN